MSDLRLLQLAAGKTDEILVGLAEPLRLGQPMKAVAHS